jgi:hypothetical protein
MRYKSSNTLGSVVGVSGKASSMQLFDILAVAVALCCYLAEAFVVHCKENPTYVFLFWE